MNWGSTISMILQVILFVVASTMAIFMVLLKDKSKTREHFVDIGAIEASFTKVLGRMPNKNESDYFASLAESSGYTSLEFDMLLTKIVGDVKKGYNEVLKRDPTAEELAECVSSFTTYKYSYEDVTKYIQLKHYDNGKPMLPTSPTSNRPLTEQDVVNIYVRLLNRDPTSEEIGKYVTLLNNKLVDTKGIEEILKASNEYKQKQASDKAQDLANNIESINKTYSSSSSSSLPEDDKMRKYQIYTDVISLYQKVLQRNPNEQEMDLYVSKVEAREIDLLQLRLILEASEEYRMLIKSQTNTVHGEASRGLAERQIKFMIGAQFTKVYGRNPTEGEASFLTDKIKAYNMDERTLYKYIKQLRDMEGQSQNLNRSVDLILPSLQDDEDVGYGLTVGSSSASNGPSNNTRSTKRETFYKFSPGSIENDQVVFETAEQIAKMALADNSKPAGYVQFLNERNNEVRTAMTEQYSMGQKIEQKMEEEKWIHDDMLILPRDLSGDWNNNYPQLSPGRKKNVKPMIAETELIGTIMPDENEIEQTAFVGTPLLLD